MMTGTLLTLDGVHRHFRTRGGVVRAVDGVSLSVGAGETVGLVGESGSGKSTLGRVALRLYDPTAGTISFQGEDITRVRGRRLRRLRVNMQMVFQDPLASLDPRMRVAEIVAEPMRELLDLTKSEQGRRVHDVLDLVNLPERILHSYPRELSGGQAQRVSFARVLAVEPSLVIADEPVSSLDASVAAQIVKLMADLQRKKGLSYLFITHDLSVVRQLADRVAVMYLGRIVEEAPTDQLFATPSHPYTAALMSAIPDADAALRGNRHRIVLPGEPPDPTAILSGCRFRERCPVGPLFHQERTKCVISDPSLMPSGTALAACHFPNPSSAVTTQPAFASLDEGD